MKKILFSLLLLLLFSEIVDARWVLADFDVSNESGGRAVTGTVNIIPYTPTENRYYDDYFRLMRAGSPINIMHGTESSQFQGKNTDIKQLGNFSWISGAGLEGGDIYTFDELTYMQTGDHILAWIYVGDSETGNQAHLVWFSEKYEDIREYFYLIPPSSPLSSSTPCNFLDYSGLSDWDIVGHLRVLLTFLYGALGCYLDILLASLYNHLYNIVAIPVTLITDLFTWIINGIVAILGFIADIIALVATLLYMLGATLFLLLPPEWIAILIIGIDVVLGFRIYHLVKGISIFGWKIG